MSDPTMQSLLEGNNMLDNITRWLIQRLTAEKFKLLAEGTKLLADLKAEFSAVEQKVVSEIKANV